VVRTDYRNTSEKLLTTAQATYLCRPQRADHRCQTERARGQTYT
jgi:hypothetical protein